MDPEHPPTLRGDASIDSQLDDLRAQLQTLRDRVLNLERATPYQNPADDGAAVESGDAGRSWLSHSAVLRRVATISFVLVIALVLRTLTEGGIVDPVLGVWLGIGYAVLLMAVGWRNLARNRSGQRVFTVCGAVLLCTLVLETHARFDYLGAATARGLLAATLLASVGLGVRYRTPIVVEAGALTAATTALVIGFPLPHFPFAASMLVLATLAGTALIGVRRAAWMHWVALAQLFFFWLLWAIKLQAALDHPEAIAPELMLAWYLPALGVTFAVLLAASCRSSRPGPFALALPALNVAWAFAAAGAVVLPWLSADRWLGAVALCLAIVHLSLAWLFARRPAADPARATAFVLAAATAFVPATWLLTGSAPAAATTWALLAVGIAWWSGRLGSGGMRAIACCLQVGTTMTAFAAGAFATPPPAPWRAMLLGAALATIAAVHYRWTRATAPREASWYARLSPTDRPGALLLWACVAAAFGCLRVATHPALASMPIDVDNAFSGAESVLLNAIAITLLVLAHRNRSRPALTAAVLVATIGGIKVFASDFFSLHGVPLVLGVFSFGMTAAVASVILGRWQRAVQPAAG